MGAIHPILALSIFFCLTLIVYLFFRPRNGFYWQYRKGLKATKKIITEDVLKYLFHEEGKERKVSLSNLINVLRVDEDRLLEILAAMHANELIETNQAMIGLLPQGRDYALRIIRIHRLYEKFLSEKTGYDKKEWHDKAEEAEHQFDAQEVHDLAVKLGHPRFDPHGDPIPTRDGEFVAVDGKILSELPVNTVARIIQIQDNPDVIYRQILAENIHIGSQVRILESNSKRVRFYSEGEEYILAPVVASSLVVTVFEKEEEIVKDIVRLSSLKLGEQATVVSISRECRGEARRRLLDLGFVMGSEIRVDLLNPLSDPTAYLVKGATIALRNNLANKILIKKE